MEHKTEFKFTLPVGQGLKTDLGSKITGVMRLARVSDIVQINQDDRVKRMPSFFYVILLSRVVRTVGTEKMVTVKTIENLCPEDFSFLVDLFNEINHQLVRSVPLVCSSCGTRFKGEFALVGEA